MKINWTKVNKQLTKECTSWGKYDGFNYVSNGYFLIKTLDIPTSTQTKLLGLLGKFPEEDTKDFMVIREGHITTSNIFKDMIDDYEPKYSITPTKLIEVQTDKKGKQIKLEVFIISVDDLDRYYYINNKFIDFIEEYEGQTKSSSAIQPALFEDDSATKVIALPVRKQFNNENLKELNKVE